jgi:hypothetical protein
MKKKRNLIICCLGVALIASTMLGQIACKKIINLGLHNTSPQLVISGLVTNLNSPYEVQLQYSEGLNQTDSFPNVSGASIIISSDDGIRDSLTQESSGIYQGHGGWVGEPGHTYSLEVSLLGKTYTGVSTMPYPVPLDSVGFTETYQGSQIGNVIEAVPYFQDPPDTANYYWFLEYFNGVYINETFIFDDQYSNGKYINVPVYDDSSHLKVGGKLLFVMNCIDVNVYNYLNDLQILQYAFLENQTSPENPQSNISGGVLGYFGAITVQSVETTVELP